MSRFRWLAAATLAAVGLVGGAVLWWFWPRPDYAFVVVDESNGLPPVGWSGTEVAPVAWYDGDGGLYVPHGALRPWHRLVCLHDVDAAGVRVASRILARRGFPARIPLDDPVPGVDECSRVLAGPLQVLGLGTGQELRLRYAGHDIVLAAGQSWAQLRVIGERGEQVFSPADPGGWEGAVGEALATGCPVTRLVITYHGIWARARITPVKQGSSLGPVKQGSSPTTARQVSSLGEAGRCA